MSLDLLSYNVFKHPTDEAKTNLEITNGMNYLFLAKASAGTNVRVRLNSNTADEISLDQNYAINTKGLKELFVSWDSVAGGTVEIIQAKNSDIFQMFTSPKMGDIDEIGTINAFSSTLLNELSNAMNPYNVTSSESHIHSTAITTLLSKTLTCDKIKIKICAGIQSDTANKRRPYGFIDVKINGTIIAVADGNNNVSDTQWEDEIEIYVNSGDSLEIVGRAGDTTGNRQTGYILNEFYPK